MCVGLLCFGQSVTGVVPSDTAYPKITIDFTYRNPDPINESALLIEAGEEVPYELFTRSDKNLYTNKRILLLFEHSYFDRFKKQRERGIAFFKSVFKESINPGDEVYIAQFDWTRDGDYNFVLLNNRPVDSPRDINRLLDQIETPDNDGRLHKDVTEIYPNIMDGLTFLAEKASPNDKIAPLITIYSCEYSSIYNPRYSANDIVLRSRELDIPIYSVKYPYYKDKHSFDEITERTYGERIALENEGEEAREFANMLNNVEKRASGKRYTIQFDVPSTSVGRDHLITLQLSNIEKLDFTYSTSNKFVYWFRKPVNKVISIGGLALLLAGIIFLLVNFKRRRDKQHAANQRLQEKKIQQASSEAAQALAQQKSQFDQELKNREKAAVEEKKKQLLEQNRRLLTSKYAQLARVPCLVSEEGKQYPINKPRMTIGRNANADCVLPHSSISKKHAVIAFSSYADDYSINSEGSMYIWDLGSTNGTYVNGKPVITSQDIRSGKMPTVLKDQDLVMFGGAQFIFTI